MNHRLAGIVVTLAAALGAGAAVAQEKNDREKKVRGDKEHVAAIDSWIYDDLPRGIAEAKKTGKPLLVVFRCIPCEACAKIDEDVVDRDPVVAKLLDQFVCVRIPHANGMDLSIFQFDYDQSWAAFLMDADLTIYHRYGTRSDRTHSENDVSLEGFAEALTMALYDHAHRAEFLATRTKPGAPPDAKTPEAFPSMQGKYTSSLDWEGKVVASCIHCHQIGEAQRRVWRDAGKPIPDKVLFPYPNPKVLGLVMDPKRATIVKSVEAGSSAAKDGFVPGDEIQELDGQSMGSIADVQWVLHNAGDAASVKATVFHEGVRKGMPPETLTLPPGWRTKGDISWRATSWDLRRMLTGGMLLEDVPDEERVKLGLEKTSMALRAKHVGQFGEHAIAKNAGFVKDDLIVAVGGNTARTSESALFASLAKSTKAGDKVAFTALRDGKKVEMSLSMQ